MFSKKMAKGNNPTKIITVDNIDVEFHSVKKDRYNNIVYYFNVTGEVNKLTSMLQSCEYKCYIMPMLLTCKIEIILKLNVYIKSSCVFF